MEKRITIINGPNLNMLGSRQPQHYGTRGFDSYLQELKQQFSGLPIAYHQSNREGELVDLLQQSAARSSGIVLNAGAFTHTSVALADAVSSLRIPVVEVHISNVWRREAFRQHSYLSPVCAGVIAGFGLQSYKLAIEYLVFEGEVDQD